MKKWNTSLETLRQYPWESDIEFYFIKSNFESISDDDFIVETDYLDDYPECNHPPLEDIL